MGILSRKKKTEQQTPQDLRVKFDPVISKNESPLNTNSMTETMDKIEALQTQRIREQEENFAQMREEMAPEANHWAEVLTQKEQELTLAAQEERDAELAAFSAQNEEEIKAEVEADKYRYVFEQRKSHFEGRNPELNREDFASEEEYKSALIEQYKSVRRDEYEALCYDRGVNFYNDSKDIIIAQKDFDVMDDFMWQSEARMRQQALKQDISLSPDSTAFHSQFVSERLTREKDGASTGHFESCAVTSCALVHDVCDRFGMSESDNPIIFEHRDEKTGILGADGGSYGKCPCPNGSGNFRELLESGKVGVGDRVSFRTGTANNTTTGYHQRTVIAVEKDKDGKVVAYTLHANNPCELSYHKINEATETVKYSSTSRYVDQKIDQEASGLQDMSVEQLKQQLATAKQRTVDVYENTSLNTEKRFLENPLSSKSAGYKREERRSTQCKREAIFTKHYNEAYVNQTIQAEVSARTERYAETLTPVDNIVRAGMAEFRHDSPEFRAFERQAMMCGFEHPIFDYISQDSETHQEASAEEVREVMKKDRSEASNLVSQLIQAAEPVHNDHNAENSKQADNQISAIIRKQSGKSMG